MSGGVAVVRLDGIRDLQKALRDLDAALPRELRKVNLAVAQGIAAKAAAKAAGLGGVAAKAASAIKASADQRSASVVLRATASAPFAFGAEFGAGHNTPRSRRNGQYAGYNQFKPWRGNSSDAGYFLYPTIRAENQHIVDEYAQRLDVLLAKAFPS